MILVCNSGNTGGQTDEANKQKKTFLVVFSIQRKEESVLMKGPRDAHCF